MKYMNSPIPLLILGLVALACGTAGAATARPEAAAGGAPVAAAPTPFPLPPTPSGWVDPPPTPRRPIPLQRAPGCSAAQTAQVPTTLPVFPNARFFAQCDTATAMVWQFWIPGARTVVVSAGNRLTPLEWYEKELSARGFRVEWNRSRGTPYHLEFSGQGVTGTIAVVATDPPAEAVGERFVGSLSIVVNR